MAKTGRAVKSKMPKVVKSPKAMFAISGRLRMGGSRIALIPTMGYLHEGHATLLRRGRAVSDVLVASIFVNPMQFGPKEDLSRYPRDLGRDMAICRECGVDYVFYPDASGMYPAGFDTVVSVREASKGLCGDLRPGHFDGVATVVLKLFNIVRPHTVFFGEKDYQQLAVIKRMTLDLDLGIKVVGAPTVRDPDGLAMSSRNVYLSPEERERALALPRALVEAEELFSSGERKTAQLREAAMRQLAGAGLEIQYVEVRTEDLSRTELLAGSGVILAAVKVGKTRLIDNRIMGRKRR